MHLQLFAILLVAVTYHSCATVPLMNSTKPAVNRAILQRWYGPSYRPKGWDPASYTATRSGDGESTHFGYDPPHGAETWPDDFPECGGDRQSPINLQSQTLDNRLSREPLTFNNYDVVPSILEFENSGHSMHLTGEWADESRTPTITGGPLDEGTVYEFSQLHFHWGRDNSKGSEHTINHKRFPCEMHVVHSKRGENSANAFEEVPDDIAVVGYVCEIQQYENKAFSKMLEACRRIRQPGKKTEIPSFKIAELLREFESDYVTYEGSLTTPPCSENVKWIVSSKPIRLSQNQIQELRSCIRDENGRTMQNYRPVQRINDRTLYYLTY